MNEHEDNWEVPAKLLTVKYGLEIQQEHLENWKRKLNADCYLALFDYVQKHKREHTYQSGLDVPREYDLADFVINWKPKS